MYFLACHSLQILNISLCKKNYKCRKTLFYSEHDLCYSVKQITLHCKLWLKIEQLLLVYHILSMKHRKLLLKKSCISLLIMNYKEMFFFINIVVEMRTFLDNWEVRRYNENQFHIAKRWTKEWSMLHQAPVQWEGILP